MAEDDISRTVGQLEGKISGISTEIRDLKQGATDARMQLKAHSEETAKKLAEISKTLNEARGGWRALVFVGSIVGGIAGFGATFLAKMKGGL